MLLRRELSLDEELLVCFQFAFDQLVLKCALLDSRLDLFYLLHDMVELLLSFKRLPTYSIKQLSQLAISGFMLIQIALNNFNPLSLFVNLHLQARSQLDLYCLLRLHNWMYQSNNHLPDPLLQHHLVNAQLPLPRCALRIVQIRNRTILRQHLLHLLLGQLTHWLHLYLIFDVLLP